MTDEDPSQDRIAELIARINQMDELLRQQAWRLYHLEQRLGLTPPPGPQAAARPPRPTPRASAPPTPAAPPSVTKDTVVPPLPAPEARPSGTPGTQTPSEAISFITVPPEATAPPPRETHS